MRRMFAVVAGLVALLLSGAAVPRASASPSTEAAEAEFVARINRLRVGKGLGALAVEASMTALARNWAAKMAAADRISHNPRLSRDVAVDWEKVGENVGVGMTVDRLHDAFIASPSHYKNLVDRDFTHIGVGVVFGRDGAMFTAHEFLQFRTPPAAEPAPPTTAAAAPPPPAPRLPLKTTTTAAPLPRTPTPRLITVLAQLAALDRGQ